MYKTSASLQSKDRGAFDDNSKHSVHTVVPQAIKDLTDRAHLSQLESKESKCIESCIVNMSCFIYANNSVLKNAIVLFYVKTTL